MTEAAASLPPGQGELLVVDDEPFLREAVAASLRFLGFEVTTAENGAGALRLARDRPFDLVVLDVMLPDTDGFEVVARLRRDGLRVPVIFLTARDTQADKVNGLTIGGDDYLTKPFGLEELAARIRTVLRRTRPATDAGPVLTFADIELDQDSYEVRRAGHLVEQYGVGFVGGKRPREFVSGNPGLVPRIPPGQLLRLLAANHGGQDVISADHGGTLRLGAIREPGGFLYATTSLSDVSSTVDHLELILAIASVAVGLAVAGGIGLVLRRGLRPIERMAGQADKITAGDLTERVRPQDPGTEVGRLGAALNGMLTRIETSVGEREASQELTRRFFADASHELRNPLASLRANAELYQQGALREPHQVDEAMRRIAHEAQRMSALVDDMLRLARLDQHPGQHAEPVDVTALVTECAERAAITDPVRAWHTDIAPGLSSTGDEELLRRAVDNLLANVRAHTPGHTTATLTAAQCNGSITIEVSDDGPGVPPDQLARIFDRFYRNGPGRGCPPGSGLGLAIVNAVAVTHDGTAQASLNDPHGLRITLTLPASGPSPASPAAAVPHTVSAPP